MIVLMIVVIIVAMMMAINVVMIVHHLSRLTFPQQQQWTTYSVADFSLFFDIGLVDHFDDLSLIHI